MFHAVGHLPDHKGFFTHFLEFFLVAADHAQLAQRAAGNGMMALCFQRPDPQGRLLIRGFHVVPLFQGPVHRPVVRQQQKDRSGEIGVLRLPGFTLPLHFIHGKQHGLAGLGSTLALCQVQRTGPDIPHRRKPAFHAGLIIIVNAQQPHLAAMLRIFNRTDKTLHIMVHHRPEIVVPVRLSGILNDDQRYDALPFIGRIHSYIAPFGGSSHQNTYFSIRDIHGIKGHLPSQYHCTASQFCLFSKIVCRGKNPRLAPGICQAVTR